MEGRETFSTGEPEAHRDKIFPNLMAINVDYGTASTATEPAILVSAHDDSVISGVTDTCSLCEGQFNDVPPLLTDFAEEVNSDAEDSAHALLSEDYHSSSAPASMNKPATVQTPLVITTGMLDIQSTTSLPTVAMASEQVSRTLSHAVPSSLSVTCTLPSTLAVESSSLDTGVLDAYIRSPEIQNAIVERSPGGRYVRFMEKLGSGASKDVYRAYDTQEGIEVAWNVINLCGVPNTERNRIINEVTLLERLHHNNIISFHGSWVIRERQEINFVTELLSSGTLKSFINKVQVIRWKIAKRWAVQILNGLEYLHSQDPPVIHRDLKCENIFINGTSGDLRIGDLGLSTVHRNGRVLSVLGTPEFMAPDMYEETSYDERVDIYAFGMCMLEIFTKEIPYSECNNPAQIYKKVSNGELPEVLSRLQSRHARDFVILCLGFKDANGVYVRPSAKELLQHEFLLKRANDEDEVLVDPPIRARVIMEAGESSTSPNITPSSKQQSEAKLFLGQTTFDAGTNTVEMLAPTPTSRQQQSSKLYVDDDDDADQFEKMPQSETNMRKVKVLMGRGQELEEDDIPASPLRDTGPMNAETSVTASSSRRMTCAPLPMNSLTSAPSLPSNSLTSAPFLPSKSSTPAPPLPILPTPQTLLTEQETIPQPQTTGWQHYLVAAAVIEHENINTRPYPDDVLKLVVTLPVEGQTQNVQFDFHLVEDDPVKVAKEMVQELGIPPGAVFEISETISSLASVARMKVDQFNQIQRQNMLHTQQGLQPSQGNDISQNQQILSIGTTLPEHVHSLTVQQQGQQHQATLEHGIQVEEFTNVTYLSSQKQTAQMGPGVHLSGQSLVHSTGHVQMPVTASAMQQHYSRQQAFTLDSSGQLSGQQSNPAQLQSNANANSVQSTTTQQQGLSMDQSGQMSMHQITQQVGYVQLQSHPNINYAQSHTLPHQGHSMEPSGQIVGLPLTQQSGHMHLNTIQVSSSQQQQQQQQQPQHQGFQVDSNASLPSHGLTQHVSGQPPFVSSHSQHIQQQGLQIDHIPSSTVGQQSNQMHLPSQTNMMQQQLPHHQNFMENMSSQTMGQQPSLVQQSHMVTSGYLNAADAHQTHRASMHLQHQPPMQHAYQRLVQGLPQQHVANMQAAPHQQSNDQISQSTQQLNVSLPPVPHLHNNNQFLQSSQQQGDSSITSASQQQLFNQSRQSSQQHGVNTSLVVTQQSSNQLHQNAQQFGANVLSGQTHQSGNQANQNHQQQNSSIPPSVPTQQFGANVPSVSGQNQQTNNQLSQTKQQQSSTMSSVSVQNLGAHVSLGQSNQPGSQPYQSNQQQSSNISYASAQHPGSNTFLSQSHQLSSEINHINQQHNTVVPSVSAQQLGVIVPPAEPNQLSGQLHQINQQQSSTMPPLSAQQFGVNGLLAQTHQSTQTSQQQSLSVPPALAQQFGVNVLPGQSYSSCNQMNQSVQLQSVPPVPAHQSGFQHAQPNQQQSLVMSKQTEQSNTVLSQTVQTPANSVTSTQSTPPQAPIDSHRAPPSLHQSLPPSHPAGQVTTSSLLAATAHSAGHSRSRTVSDVIESAPSQPVNPVVQRSTSIGSALPPQYGNQPPNDVLEPTSSLETDQSMDSDMEEEMRKLEDDFQRNLQRMKKVFDNRMDNLQRSQVEREAQHQKTLEKHQKERVDYEKRLAQEAEQQNKRLEQLQREWEKKRESLAQYRRKHAIAGKVVNAASNGMLPYSETDDFVIKTATAPSHKRNVSTNSTTSDSLLSSALFEHKQPQLDSNGIHER